ncbi:MAG: pyruvate formate-lyase [Clostridia bacterium]|nr:pyruvate formate-lyase [Clostridia bacterium]
MNQPLYDFITAHRQREFRIDAIPSQAERYKAEGLSPRARMSDRFCRVMDAEVPHILPGQKIVFLRTVPRPYDCFTEDEWNAIRSHHFLHEQGYLSNICPDHTYLMKRGLLAVRESADEYAKADIDALLRLVSRYRDEALRTGRDDVAEVLEKVPAQPAETFREALQFFRIIHYALWLEGNYHNTVGRFDKYMMPYLEADLAAGRLTEDEAYELLLDFFLSFNIDSDMYTGIQQGDNGQSMMLGGTDPATGSEIYNKLTAMCLRASGELKLIDPKINLRVTKNTPLWVYEEGTKLTKVGLGFPQYSNDDTVIPALMKLGYDKADAEDYTVAACWEFIIPGLGMEIANIGAMSYPLAVDRALSSLPSCADFDEFRANVAAEITAQCDAIMAGVKNIWFVPSPFMELLYGGKPVTEGMKYNNFGIHGTGVSCAADSLAAIKTYVFDEKKLTADELLAAVNADFEGYDETLHLLRSESPKLGTENSAAADEQLVWLTEAFSGTLAGKTNERGGIWRAGTGSAMFYLWHADEIGASPDGRRKGEPFAANYSASLFAKIDNPVNIVKSFTAPDLGKVINGGPLTLEFDSRIFASDENMTKVASLVKYFVARGGHQLQLNAVSREALLDAQAHPEKYERLIVRIWGWSAYFVELDKNFQDHVIRRQEYSI